MTASSVRRSFFFLLAFVICLAPPASRAAENSGTLMIKADVLRDKIHGGFLGQLFGNLNGLPHEFAYIPEPGNVSGYVPGLAYAFTDDDNDIEWVYITEMEKSGNAIIPYDRIKELWFKHLNRGIFASNAWARGLMGMGIDPPMTGHPGLNPRAHYNIAGQFNIETFGLIALGMPQTAARIGDHYAHVVVDGEPVQAAQLYTTMIATAFLTDDLNEILDAGLAAVDPLSQIYEIVNQARA